MSVFLFANNAQTTLAGAITNVAVTANLQSGAGVLFPAPGAGQLFCGTFVDAATGLITEIVHVTNVTGDVITMVRAQESTTAEAWGAGDIFGNFWTAGQAGIMTQAATLQIQPGNYAVDSGTANAMVANLSQVPVSLASIIGSPIRIKKGASANTGATTLVLNSLAAVAIVTTAGATLTAGALPSGSLMSLIYDGTNFVLQSSPANTVTAQPAVRSVTNLKGVFGSTTTATWTADEIMVETALGGTPYKLASFNQTLNTGTVGIGGLDTATGFVAGVDLFIYAAYNPTTQTQGIFGTITGGGSIYSGSHLPAGFTATALISSLKIAAGSAIIQQFVQFGWAIDILRQSALSSGSAGSYTSVSISAIVPANAVRWSGDLNSGANTASSIAADTSGTGEILIGNVSVTGGTSQSAINSVPFITAQVFFYKIGSGANVSVSVNRYSI